MSRDFTRREMGYPTEDEMRTPLLRAIGRRGGAIRLSRDGAGIEKELADHFGLSVWQREYSDPSRFRSKGARAWRNHIQFVRRHLADEGLIIKGTRDLWALSEAGNA